MSIQHSAVEFNSQATAVSIASGNVVSTSGDQDRYETDRANRLIRLTNKNLEQMTDDVLYHLALDTRTHDMQAMFNDVKFVCVGGSPRRMEQVAHYMLKQLNYELPTGQALVNICGGTDRYAMFKVGPVLLISHGIGISSFSVMMHEVIKVLHYAKAKDVCCFRLGTSGGLGLEPGTVVISEQAVDGLMQPNYEMVILGKVVSRPAILDHELQQGLLQCVHPDDSFQTVIGKTMCTSDFYEGQGRLDGAFCEYTKQEKMAFLQQAHRQGVRNIEMESQCFAAMCHKANMRGAVVCVTLLDRLRGDQVTTPRDLLRAWEERGAALVARYVRKHLGLEK